MKSMLIRDGIFLTMDPAQPVVEGCCMTVENGRITFIGQNVPEDKTFAEVIDGKNRLFMPGLINTHNHAAMSLLRGYADDLALKVWLEEKMWPNEAKFTDEDVRWGALLSIVEMIKSGTTCFVDMYDHMDEVAGAVEMSGIRACLTRGMIGLGGEDEQRAKLAEARAFVENWHGQADGRITTMMSPHAPYTCPPAFIRQIVETARELNVPIHTHMSETASEVEWNVKEYGKRPVEHLLELGVFDGPCLVAHAVHLNNEEIDILREHDVKVSHNPGSNLKLASGIARVPDMLQKGITVSIGTDSSASNNNLDMFEEIRLAALIHKGVSGDPTAVPAEQALRMGTVMGAEALWLEDVGILKPGMKADLIALDMSEAHWYPSGHYISHLVYAASARDVTDVWVDGRPLMRNRELVTLDEERIKWEFQKRFERIMA